MPFMCGVASSIVFLPFIFMLRCLVQLVTCCGCSIICHCFADAGLCFGYPTGFISQGGRHMVSCPRSVKSDMHAVTDKQFVL